MVWRGYPEVANNCIWKLAPPHWVRTSPVKTFVDFSYAKDSSCSSPRVACNFRTCLRGLVTSIEVVTAWRTPYLPSIIHVNIYNSTNVIFNKTDHFFRHLAKWQSTNTYVKICKSRFTSLEFCKFFSNDQGQLSWTRLRSIWLSFSKNQFPSSNLKSMPLNINVDLRASAWKSYWDKRRPTKYNSYASESEYQRLEEIITPFSSASASDRVVCNWLNPESMDWNKIQRSRR